MTNNKSGNDKTHHYITNKVKLGAFEGIMLQVREELNKPLNITSKLIHNDLIEKISDVCAITIARPKSILGASLFVVFIGILLIVTANEYGFDLPMTTLIVLYVIGYLVSLLLELFINIVLKFKN